MIYYAISFFDLDLKILYNAKMKLHVIDGEVALGALTGYSNLQTNDDTFMDNALKEWILWR